MARRRGEETIRDMVLSLGVVMAGVLIFAVFVMPRADREPEVRVVDTATPVAAFARQAPFDVLAPDGLPDIWKATSVRAQVPSGSSDDEAAELSIGYVVDEPDNRRFVRYVASADPEAVQAQLGDRPVTGTQLVAGSQWDRRDAEDGHLALTRALDGIVLIVDDGGGEGGGTEDDLVRLAGSLRPVEAPAAE